MSAPGVYDCRQQLVVLAEAEIVDGRALGARNAIEVDDQSTMRALCNVPGVARDPVGDIDQRVGVRGELRVPPRAGSAAERALPLAERCAGGTELARDDKQVARSGAGPSRNALGAAEGGYRQVELVGRGRIAADDVDARLGDPLVELEH